MRISQNLFFFGRFIPDFFLASFPSLFLSLSFLFIFSLLSPSYPLKTFLPQPFKKPGNGTLINYRWLGLFCHQFCTQNWTRFSGINSSARRGSMLKLGTRRDGSVLAAYHLWRQKWWRHKWFNVNSSKCRQNSTFAAKLLILHLPNLVPRFLRLLGQRVVAGRDSGVMELLPQESCGKRFLVLLQWTALEQRRLAHLDANLPYPSLTPESLPATTRWPRSPRTPGTR